MNYWIDTACIMFVCVTANHLGLIKAIGDFTKLDIPIVNCPKCATFWFSVIYGMGKMGFQWENIIPLLAVSLLASYLAIWLELLEGYIDTLYTKLYEKIYPNTTNDTAAADSDDGYSAGNVPEL